MIPRALPLFPLDPHVHLRRAVAVELDGVADQVLEQLNQLPGVGRHGRQRVVRHPRATLFNRDLQIGQRVAQDDGAIGRLEGFAARAHTRIGQQVVDEYLHAAYPIHGIADELVGI